MTFNNSKSGIGNVAEYQAAGWPWVTASVAPITTPQLISFPYVTSHIYLQNNSGNTLVFGFTRNGTLGTNRYELPTTKAIDINIKTNKLFVMGVGGTAAYSLLAGLTGIEYVSYPTLTGSAASGSLELSYGLPSTPGSGSGLG